MARWQAILINSFSLPVLAMNSMVSSASSKVKAGDTENNHLKRKAGYPWGSTPAPGIPVPQNRIPARGCPYPYPRRFFPGSMRSYLDAYWAPARGAPTIRFAPLVRIVGVPLAGILSGGQVTLYPLWVLVSPGGCQFTCAQFPSLVPLPSGHTPLPFVHILR